MLLAAAAEPETGYAVPVVVAALALVGVLGSPIVTAIVQRRVQRQNRSDHDDVARLAMQVHDRLVELSDVVGRIDERTTAQIAQTAADIARVERVITEHVVWEMEQRHMTPAEIRQLVDELIVVAHANQPPFPHQGDTP